MQARSRGVDYGLLVAVALVSLVLDVATDRLLGRVLGSGLAWIRTLHLVPLAVSAALYVACGPNESWKLPRSEDVKRGWLAIVIWLGLFALVLGLHLLLAKNVTKREIVLGVVDLMVTHLLAQELLFRGALVALAGRLWPATDLDFGDVSFRTLGITSLLFALSQIQYQSTFATAAPWWQMLRALVLGAFMCGLRGTMRSVWASVAFHAVNNALIGFR